MTDSPIQEGWLRTELPVDDVSVSLYGIDDDGKPVTLRVYYDRGATVTKAMRIVTREEWLAAGGDPHPPPRGEH